MVPDRQDLQIILTVLFTSVAYMPGATQIVSRAALRRAVAAGPHHKRASKGQHSLQTEYLCILSDLPVDFPDIASTTARALLPSQHHQ